MKFELNQSGNTLLKCTGVALVIAFIYGVFGGIEYVSGNALRIDGAAKSLYLTFASLFGYFVVLPLALIQISFTLLRRKNLDCLDKFFALFAGIMCGMIAMLYLYVAGTN